MVSAASKAAKISGYQDRQPIFSEEAEKGLLGSILIDSARVLDFCIEKKLRPESFYLRNHQVIFETISEMPGANRPVDAVTVVERLGAAGTIESVGGVEYIDELMASTPTAAHAEYYLDIVLQKHTLRRIVDSARKAENSCYGADDNAFSVLGEVEQMFFDIGEERTGRIVPWKTAVDASMEEIHRILETKSGVTGIQTGFMDLDDKTRGLHRGDMIVLAARPSMGKTSLAMNIVENIALGHKSEDHVPRPVAIFSLEMSREQLVQRMICSRAEVSFHTIISGRLSGTDHRKLMDAADSMVKAEIFLDDTPAIDIDGLRSSARRLKKKHDIDLIVIDYMQLLHSRNSRVENRQQEISEISRGIKAMAKELNLPVLVLSQLNRSPEAKDRSGKPRLADLRESGSIEQDADVVCLLMRPSKYEDPDNAKTDKHEALLDIAKQRNGPTGIIKLYFEEDITRFYDAAPKYMAEEEPAHATPQV